MAKRIDKAQLLYDYLCDMEDSGNYNDYSGNFVPTDDQIREHTGINSVPYNLKKLEDAGRIRRNTRYNQETGKRDRFIVINKW